MKTIEVKIENGMAVATDLVGGPEVAFGKWLEGPGGVRFLIEPRMQYHSMNWSDAAMIFVVNVGSGVTVAAIAKWLFRGTRRKRTRIHVNNREITAQTEEEFMRAIEQEVDMEREEEESK